MLYTNVDIPRKTSIVGDNGNNTITDTTDLNKSHMAIGHKLSSPGPKPLVSKLKPKGLGLTLKSYRQPHNPTSVKKIKVDSERMDME